MKKNKNRKLSYNKYYGQYKLKVPKYLVNAVYEACKDNNDFVYSKNETELALFCLFFEILRALRDNFFVKLHNFGIFSFYKKDAIIRDLEGNVRIVEDLKVCSFKFAKYVDVFLFKLLNKDNHIYYEHIKAKTEERRLLNEDK